MKIGKQYGYLAVVKVLRNKLKLRCNCGNVTIRSKHSVRRSVRKKSKLMCRECRDRLTTHRSYLEKWEKTRSLYSMMDEHTILQDIRTAISCSMGEVEQDVRVQIDESWTQTTVNWGIVGIRG